jgi:hypothetical protein
MAKTIDRSALSDRWDGDVFEFGKRVLPEPGPKIGIHWGNLLMLEKHLRDIQDGLRDVMKADAQDNPVPEGGDYTDVHFSASTTLDLALWLETQIRGLRTGEWPEDDTDSSGQSPLGKPAISKPSQDDDPDTPF